MWALRRERARETQGERENVDWTIGPLSMDLRTRTHPDVWPLSFERGHEWQARESLCSPSWRSQCFRSGLLVTSQLWSSAGSNGPLTCLRWHIYISAVVVQHFYNKCDQLCVSVSCLCGILSLLQTSCLFQSECLHTASLFPAHTHSLLRSSHSATRVLL